MITISSALEKALFISQTSDIKFKLEIESLHDGVTYDVTPLIKNAGKISRKLEYDTGKFSPGSHSFDLMNTKDLGAFILSHGAYLGTDFWMDKVYNLYIGSGTEYIHLYTGTIYNKKEDRLKGTVTVGSKDIMKAIADYEVCQPIQASDVFTPTTGTDSRIFQQVLKWGTHKLITNSGDTSSLRNREKPFSATLGIPAILDGTINGFSETPFTPPAPTFSAYRAWYFPFQNRVAIGNSGHGTRVQYYSDGTVRLFYWDYRKEYRIWRAFDATVFSRSVYVAGTVGVFKTSSCNGMFVNIRTDVALVTGTWADYIAGSAGWAVGTGESIDPALCIESVGVITDEPGISSWGWASSNPAALIKEMLISSRFLNISSAFIDQYAFGTPDYDFTFDSAYDFMETESAHINTDISQQTSLLKIIEDICKTSGLVFQVAAKKTSSDTTSGWGEFLWGEEPWGSLTVSQDRRIRLLILEPFAEVLGIDRLLQFSTREKIQNFIVETSSDSIKDKVVSSSFDSSVSTERVFNGYIAGTGNRAVNLSTKNIYLYDSDAFALTIAQRRLKQLEVAIITADIQLDRAGLIVECGDMAKFTEHTSGDDFIVQVSSENKDVTSGKTILFGREYTQLYGPDADNPCELWAFADYSYACEDDCATGGGFGGHSYYAF